MSKLKLSKSSQNLRKKWQADADKRGGGRIVLTQNEAMEAIKNLMCNVFKPMSITEIYEALKATVPSPVLKQSLEAMKCNQEDEGDNDVFHVKNKDERKDSEVPIQFVNSIIAKAGKNVSSCVYYLNQSILENSGNGLDIDAKQQLMSESCKAEEQLKHLLKQVKENEKETSILLAQPNNNDLEAMLVSAKELNDALLEEIELARQFSSNASNRKKLLKKLEVFAKQWHIRKRKCNDFLDFIEDSSEGSVKKKNCLNGSGQIEIESDEKAIEAAKQFHKRMMEKRGESNEGNLFVGVTITSSKGVERVFL